MDRKEYRRNSETIASLLLPLKMHCNENTNKCIDETLRAWSKLEKIEQIIGEWNDDWQASQKDLWMYLANIKEVLEQE